MRRTNTELRKDCVAASQNGTHFARICLFVDSSVGNRHSVYGTGKLQMLQAKCGNAPSSGVKLFSREKKMLPREESWKLLCEYTQGESLRKHALAVEACVRAYARKLGAEEELWGTAALLHDFDYERWPNAAHDPIAEHPYEGSKILRERGYPEEVIHAILGHADYCKVPRVSPLDKTLFACDELAGFLTACALIKPSKSIHEVETASVKKKLKDKAFARGVNRDDVYKGAEELGIPLDEHIAFCIMALCHIAPQLGLNGVSTAATS
jgi:putative nucleotidyltransferase with HDIG domain